MEEGLDVGAVLVGVTGHQGPGRAHRCTAGALSTPALWGTPSALREVPCWVRGQDGTRPLPAAMGPARHRTAAVPVGIGSVDMSLCATTQPFWIHKRPLAAWALWTGKLVCCSSLKCCPKRVFHHVPVLLSFQRNFNLEAGLLNVQQEN